MLLLKKVKHNLGLRIIKVEKTQIDSIGLIAIFNWMFFATCKSLLLILIPLKNENFR